MTLVERAAATYIAVAQEPDSARRHQMLEACFAEDGKLVTRTREVVGRAAIAVMFDAFFAGDQTAQLAGAIDAVGQTFRFRANTLDITGAVVASVFDAGMIGADGKITLILTFPD